MITSPVTAATDDTFRAEVLESELPVLVEFWASWCGPCLQLAPVLDAIAHERAGRLRVVKIDQEENPVVAAQHRVLGLPTMLLFDAGEPVLELRGARPKSALDREIDRALSTRD